MLLGPVGCEPERWQTLLKREHQPPKEKLESGARALRLIHSDIVDIDLREQQLARMLAQQWLAQRGEHQLPGLSGCYWQGSEPAWREFCAELRTALSHRSVAAYGGTLAGPGQLIGDYRAH